MRSAVLCSSYVVLGSTIGLCSIQARSKAIPDPANFPNPDSPAVERSLHLAPKGCGLQILEEHLRFGLRLMALSCLAAPARATDDIGGLNGSAQAQLSSPAPCSSAKDNPGRADRPGWVQFAALLKGTTFAEGLGARRGAAFFLRRPRLASGLFRGGGAKPLASTAGAAISSHKGKASGNSSW